MAVRPTIEVRRTQLNTTPQVVRAEHRKKWRRRSNLSVSVYPVMSTVYSKLHDTILGHRAETVDSKVDHPHCEAMIGQAKQELELLAP